MDPLELRRKRASVIEQMRALINKAESERRDLSSDEARRYKDMEDQVRSLDGQIKREEGLRGLEADLNEPLEPRRTHVPGTVGEPSGFVDAEGREIRALKPEERMSDYLRRNRGDDFSEPLSMGRFIRGIVTGDWKGAEAERRSLFAGDDIMGGYLVPEDISSQVIDMARNLAACIRVGARTVPMDSGTLHLARIDEDPKAYWRGENKSITPSDMSFGKFTLTAKTLACLVKCSVEVVEDAANLDELVRRSMSEALALELDRAALFGEGTPVEPRGLYHTEGVHEIIMGAPGEDGATLTSVDPYFNARLPILTSNGMPSGVVYSPREEVWLEQLKDGDGRYLLPPESWTRMKKVSTNQIPTNMVQGQRDDASCSFTGDFSQMLIGMRTNLVIEASRQAADASGSAFGDLQIWIRGYLRADVCVVRPTWFTVIKGIVPEVA